MLALFVAMSLTFTACSSHSDSGGSSTDSEGGTTAGESISRDEAINDHWDEIKEHLTGSQDVDACSSENGRCYTLDADIESGEITEIHFNNGGHLSFSAEIDEDGNASDSDENGNSWDFTLDMNSSIVDAAIDQWAKEKGYEIQ
jgi:hypothetical protein